MDHESGHKVHDSLLDGPKGLNLAESAGRHQRARRGYWGVPDFFFRLHILYIHPCKKKFSLERRKSML
jgi:hypothetical protein